MDVFYIISNQIKKSAQTNADFIKKYLEGNGKICYVDSSAATEPDGPYRYTDAKGIPDNVECVIALGGDGTLLQASRDLVGTGLPLLGINLGTLGYLAEIEQKGILPALERLISGEYTIEERMMLNGEVEQDDGTVRSDIALNDIVLTRRGKFRVMDFNIYVDDVFLCSYRADGIILSTPTGSTGYSLSAGGPIVSPDASLILLTAVAPHTLNSRTIVLPDHVTVSVEAAGRDEGTEGYANVLFDGDTEVCLSRGHRVRVTRSEQTTRLIKIRHTSFVENLREKLK
jgi:NAD+ kinase